MPWASDTCSLRSREDGRVPPTRARRRWPRRHDETASPVALYPCPGCAIVHGMVPRRRKAGKNNASVHTADSDKQDVTEVYEIVDGAGTFVAGGTILNLAERTAGIKGGELLRFQRRLHVSSPRRRRIGSAARGIDQLPRNPLSTGWQLGDVSVSVGLLLSVPPPTRAAHAPPPPCAYPSRPEVLALAFQYE